jgi:hypothetical protein
MDIKLNSKNDGLKMRRFIKYFAVFLVVLYISTNSIPAQDTHENKKVGSPQAQEATKKKDAAQPSLQKTDQPKKKSNTQEGKTNLEKVGEILFVFLVLSIVFESALTPIFNWRVFLARFDEKGLKTPITVILALIVFRSYGLDIIKDLLDALGHPADKSWGGQILTSFLIAGGSDGIFRIYSKLNIRNPSAREEKAIKAKGAFEEKKRIAARAALEKQKRIETEKKGLEGTQ